MKAVLCSTIGGVHIHTPGTGKWEVCQCGATGACGQDEFFKLGECGVVGFERGV